MTPKIPLLWALRDRAGIQGVKYGCGVRQGSACNVWLGGLAVRSCQLTVGAIEGRAVTTVEGLATATLHPVQQAWIEHDVAQCGYCQAGQIMSAAAFLERNPSPTNDEIDAAMAGNLCRCGTYVRIKSAIKAVNLEAVRALPGVIDAFILNRAPGPYNFDIRESSAIQSGIAIVGKDTWSTFRAREGLQVDWHLSAASLDDSDVIEAEAVLGVDYPTRTSSKLRSYLDVLAHQSSCNGNAKMT